MKIKIQCIIMLLFFMNTFSEEIVLQNGVNGYFGVTDCNLWHVTATDLTASTLLNTQKPGYEDEFNSQPDGQALILYNLSC